MGKTVNKLQEFAQKHSIILNEKGEIGFGRPCVGFVHGDNYISFNPLQDGGDYEPIFGEYDDRLYPPEGVESYHKGDYVAVLVSDEKYHKGLKQLLKWVEHLESQGEVEVVEYQTGATGLQAVISGMFGRAIKFKD